MILDCLVKAIFLYLIYTGVVLLIFGAPRSLSATYYLFKERLNSLKILFPSTMLLMAIFLIPCWLEISEGSDFQFTVFLCIAGMIFVGMTPAFKESESTELVHDISAYTSAVFSLLWIFLVTPYWYVPIIMLVIFATIAYVTKTWKTAYIFWLENIVITSTFISMLAYYESIIKIVI